MVCEKGGKDRVHIRSSAEAYSLECEGFLSVFLPDVGLQRPADAPVRSSAAVSGASDSVAGALCKAAPAVPPAGGTLPQATSLPHGQSEQGARAPAATHSYVPVTKQNKRSPTTTTLSADLGNTARQPTATSSTTTTTPLTNGTNPAPARTTSKASGGSVPARAAVELNGSVLKDAGSASPASSNPNHNNNKKNNNNKNSSNSSNSSNSTSIFSSDSEESAATEEGAEASAKAAAASAESNTAAEQTVTGTATNSTSSTDKTLSRPPGKHQEVSAEGQPDKNKNTNVERAANAPTTTSTTASATVTTGSAATSTTAVTPTETATHAASEIEEPAVSLAAQTKHRGAKRSRPWSEESTAQDLKKEAASADSLYKTWRKPHLDSLEVVALVEELRIRLTEPPTTITTSTTTTTTTKTEPGLMSGSATSDLASRSLGLLCSGEAPVAIESGLLASLGDESADRVRSITEWLLARVKSLRS
ncbi:unnamed protein product [Polarella glacialis]|nr:unnamed protein product [Polarella glacialis]